MFQARSVRTALCSRVARYLHVQQWCSGGAWTTRRYRRLLQMIGMV